MSKERTKPGPGEAVREYVGRTCFLEALHSIPRPAQRFFEPTSIEPLHNLEPVWRRFEEAVGDTLPRLSYHPPRGGQPAYDVCPGGRRCEREKDTEPAGVKNIEKLDFVERLGQEPELPLLHIQPACFEHRIAAHGQWLLRQDHADKAEAAQNDQQDDGEAHVREEPPHGPQRVEDAERP